MTEKPLDAKPISDLRRRMLQDMTNRSFGDRTQHDYIRHIETFAKFLGRAPDTATSDDIRRFQAGQIAQGAQPPKMNTQASALRFFFMFTLGRVDLAHQLARTHYPRKLPRILTPDASDAGRDQFDLAFIDAEKTGYRAYFEACLLLVRPGGLIVLDNTLRRGRVADPSDVEPGTEELRMFNKMIAADERVDRVLLPVASGMTLARRR